MPPSNPSQAPSTPPVPPAPTMPPVPPAPAPSSPAGSGFSVDSLQKNQKFMETIKTFAIYGAIVYAINALLGMLISMFHFSSFYSDFNIGVLIMALIAGAIGSAIGGAVFYFLYDPIHNWVKTVPFLSKYIHDMFTLFWKPTLVVTIIAAAFGLLAMLGLGAAAVAVTSGYAAVGFFGLFIGWIIALVVHLGVYYWYAKTVSAKLTPYYPW